MNLPIALLYGDPHMITLDGFKYTYNGVGEYVVLDAQDSEFQLQARTEPVGRFDGGRSVATAFTAIAVKMRHSDRVEIQRSTFRGVNILVNGVRQSFSDRSEGLFNNVTVSYLGNDTVSIIFQSGPIVTAQNTNNLLLIQIASLPFLYKNTTKGLLGTWNGNPDDDLTRPDGNVLLPNSTLREIHEMFGEQCNLATYTTVF